MTGAERAAILSEVTGKPVRFIVIDEAQLRGGAAQAGVPKQYINSLVDIEIQFVAGDFNIVTRDIERLGGRPPQMAGSIRQEASRACPKPD